MARKKIESKKKIDMTGSQSKTAKRSRGKTKEEGFIASADMDRIIPLCGGEWAYILDPRDGRTHHLRVGSDKWNELIEVLFADERHNNRVRTQLDKLGWRNPCSDVLLGVMGPGEFRPE